jgi:hypothetical protein
VKRWPVRKRVISMDVTALFPECRRQIPKDFGRASYRIVVQPDLPPWVACDDY